MYVNRFKKPINDREELKIPAVSVISEKVGLRRKLITVPTSSITDKFKDLSADDFRLQNQLDAGVNLSKVVISGDVLDSVDRIDKQMDYIDANVKE